MSYPRTEVVYQRVGGAEYVVTDPVKGAAIQPADWQAADDEVQYDVWIRTHLSSSSIHNSAKTSVTLYSAATGGTVTTVDVGGVPHRVHTFTGNGNFVLRYPRTVEHLLVAGGGGGGSRHGGGGGAGGVLSGSGARTVDTYAITVGAGGKGRDATEAANGGNSTAFNLTAIGGGRGGSGGDRGGANSGGSGGGSEFSTGSAGTSGQGNTGGNGQGSPNWSGGGGGGAGGSGGNSSGTNDARNVAGGAGGPGVTSTITGSSVTYGGGGGGSMEYRQRGSAGSGGIGGGAAGAHSYWEVFNLRGILRWELFATSGSNPTKVEELDSMINNATRTGVGYASIGTSNRNKNGVSGTLLDWNAVSQLRTITGASVGANNSGDSFALVVTGRFWATHTDTYTFEVQSDDSADVRIGDTRVASFYGGRGMGDTNSGTISLTAGQHYSFRVRMQDGGGGEGLRVFWFRNGDATRRQEGGQIGPAHPESGSEFDSLISRAGSAAASGVNEITTQTGNATANALNWTDSNRGTVFSGVQFPNSGHDFAYMLHGTFVPSETGTYTFTVAGDDAVDVRIGDTTVAAHYGGHGISGLGVAAQTGTISLTAGQAYRFRARQEDGDGGDGLRVFWRKPSQSDSNDWFQDASELTAIGRNGADGLGGGGGAAGHNDSTNYTGGRGGNGVVIVRYPVRVTPA